MLMNKGDVPEGDSLGVLRISEIDHSNRCFLADRESRDEAAVQISLRTLLTVSAPPVRRTGALVSGALVQGLFEWRSPFERSSRWENAPITLSAGD
jgi:hypothetical protein